VAVPPNRAWPPQPETLALDGSPCQWPRRLLSAIERSEHSTLMWTGSGSSA